MNPPDLSTLRWWDNLTGTPAETRNLRVGFGQLVEQGPVDGRVLQLQINLGRVDWLLLPKHAPESDALESLGDFSQNAKYFQELVSKWWDTESLSINRLGLGVSLFVPTAGQEGAVQLIHRALPSLGGDLNDVQDLMYQVNRPRQCVAWPELGSINRIAKWQVVLRQRLLAGFLPQPQGPVSVKQQIVANLEMDLNTPLVDVTKELPREKLTPILDELIQNATEIASMGDVK